MDYNEIVVLHYQEIYSFLYRSTFDEELSKDLTQEVFLKGFRKFSRFNKDLSSPRTWLYKIASNHMIDYFRKRKLEKIELIEIKDSTDILFELLEKEKMEIIIWVIDNKLKQKYKEIILMYFFSEYTVLEISKILKLDSKTVHNRLDYSVKLLKKEVKLIYDKI
jgi:RNA polymerase sigma-70 factor (ECF subfamily)